MNSKKGKAVAALKPRREHRALSEKHGKSHASHGNMTGGGGISGGSKS